MLQITRDYFLFIRDQAFFEDEEKGQAPRDEGPHIKCFVCLEEIKADFVYIDEMYHAVCDECLEGLNAEAN